MTILDMEKDFPLGSRVKPTVIWGFGSPKSSKGIVLAHRKGEYGPNDDQVIIQWDENFCSYEFLSEIEIIDTKKSPDGMNCSKCRMNNYYAEPNQKDGSYLCYNCRS